MERIKRALDEARRQRRALAQPSPGCVGESAGATAPGSAASPPTPQANRWLRIATGVIGVSVLAGLVAVQQRQRERSVELAALERVAQISDDSVPEREQRVSTSKALGEQLAAIQAHVELLDKSVTRLQDKLRDVDQLVNSVAAAQAGAAAANPVAAEAPRSAPRSDEASPVTDHQETPSAQQPGVSGSEDAAWVINLASFPDQRGAETFAARARAEDIAVEQNPVMVKGRQYWRVRAFGFASAAEARTQADRVENRLGLKGSWVSRR